MIKLSVYDDYVGRDYRRRIPVDDIVDLPGEEWRDYKKDWMVSNMGRMKTKLRKLTIGGISHTRKPRLLMPYKYGGCTTPTFRLFDLVNLKPKYVMVTRAMWETFIGPLPDGGRMITYDMDLRVENLRIR